MQEHLPLEQKLSTYSMPQKAIDLIAQVKLVFLVGVTGAGKDTVVRELLKSATRYHNIVSHTTRKPRLNHGALEQDGIEYHFIDLKTAETMIDQQGFVEAKWVHGNIYGTSVAEIQMAHDEGKIAITEIEVQGIAEYKAATDNVLPIFLLPPDYDTWQQRLRGRYAEGEVDEADIEKRLETAKSELRDALEKPYFEYVINRDFHESVKIVELIVDGHVSTKKNDEARVVAQQLLQQLEAK